VGNRKTKFSSGPAKGLWICRPAEDGIGLILFATKSLRFASWAAAALSGVSLLIGVAALLLPDFLSELRVSVFWLAVPILTLMITIYILANSRRMLRKREMEDDPKKVDKTGKRNGFYVAIDFKDGTIRSANMQSRTKWSSVSNAECQPETEQNDTLDDGEVEVMQSVLPRLSELLHTVGRGSSMQLNNQGAGVWRFTFHRSPGSLFFLRSALILLVLAALIFLVAFVTVFPHEPVTSIVFLAGSLAAMALAFESQHKLQIPSKLSLIFAPRTQSEEENRYDMRWSIYHGMFVKMHDEWAILTHANCIKRFCTLLETFKDKERSTGFDDIDIKRFADGKGDSAENRGLSAASKADGVRFSLYPVS